MMYRILGGQNKIPQKCQTFSEAVDYQAQNGGTIYQLVFSSNGRD